MKNKTFSIILLLTALQIVTSSKSQNAFPVQGGAGWKYEGTKNGVDYYSIKPTPAPAPIPTFTITKSADQIAKEASEDAAADRRMEASHQESVRSNDSIHKAYVARDEAVRAAKYAVAYDYYKGDTHVLEYYNTKEYKKAFEKTSELIDAASSGYNEFITANTYARLGYMYENGIGTRKNLWAAAKWYQKAENRSDKGIHVLYGPWGTLSYAGKHKCEQNSQEVTCVGDFKDSKEYYRDFGTKKSRDYISGNGTVSDINTIWTGKWKRSIMNGHGTLKNKTETYDGEWLDNNPNGQGTYTWNSGADKFEGEFSWGRMSKGTLTKAGGASKYIGSFNYTSGAYVFRNSEMSSEAYGIAQGMGVGWKDGQGTYTWNSGASTYAGEFKDDLFDGQGTMTTPNGTWTGIWKEGQIDKPGYDPSQNGPDLYDLKAKIASLPSDPILNGTVSNTSDAASAAIKNENTIKNEPFTGHKTWQNTTDSYDGEWKNGVWDGQGKYSWGTGDKYAGSWKAGKQNGYGILKTASGYYEGEFKDGTFDGQGTYTWGTGEKYNGSWINGKRNGQAAVNYPDGSKYEGGFKDDEWSGEGIYTALNGIKIYAGYINGKYNNCKYKSVYPNGNIAAEYIYIDSLIQGIAKFYYEDGKLQFDENFKNGLQEGASKEFYKDGRIKQDMNYKQGKLDGEYKSYYENGMIWSDYIYRDGKTWNSITDNMPDGKPTGSNVKDGNGITMGQSPDGAVIINKTTYVNGIVIKTETLPVK